MDLTSFMQLLNFRDEVSFFKQSQLEQLLHDLSLNLPLPVVSDFLDSCSANFRTLDSKWVELLGIMLTGHSSKDGKGLKGFIGSFVSRSLFGGANSVKIETLQTKALRLMVELINGDVERSPEMLRLLVQTIERILKVPFKGDSQDLLLRVLRFFESSSSQLEILDLISLFLKDCESKKPIKSFIFGGAFSFLKNFDFLKLYYEFLSTYAIRLVQDESRVGLYFDTLETLLIKQNKLDDLNANYFLKIWKFICGNSFDVLKEKFHHFVISNYKKFLQRMGIFPFLFSKKSLEELASLKIFYAQAPPGSHSEEALRAFLKSEKTLPDISMTGTDLTNLSEQNCPQVLGTSEQFLFRILFLLENCSCSPKKITLLSPNLSDELFVTLAELSNLKGFDELWHAVKFLPDTPHLKEFLLKLYRSSGFNHLVFPLEEGQINLTKLNLSQVPNSWKGVVQKYHISENSMQVNDLNSADNPIQEIIKKKRFELCNRMINNLKSGIEFHNQIVIRNMLLLLRKFLVTNLGFLGEKSSISSDVSVCQKM